MQFITLGSWQQLGLPMGWGGRASCSHAVPPEESRPQPPRSSGHSHPRQQDGVEHGHSPFHLPPSLTRFARISSSLAQGHFTLPPSIQGWAKRPEESRQKPVIQGSSSCCTPHPRMPQRCYLDSSPTPLLSRYPQEGAKEGSGKVKSPLFPGHKGSPEWEPGLSQCSREAPGDTQCSWGKGSLPGLDRLEGWRRNRRGGGVGPPSLAEPRKGYFLKVDF